MSNRPSVWACAASFGALWGAVEVTVGSFLHALHLPGTGPFLSAVAAAFLVAQRVMLPRPGLSVATALVAALLKGLSPAGALIGPMLAIFMEGVLAELLFMLLGANALSAFFCGVLAVLWSLLQKLAFQVVLYGGDIIKLYLELLGRGAAFLGLDPEKGLPLVLLFFLGLACAAGLVATRGVALGRAALALPSGPADAANSQPGGAP